MIKGLIQQEDVITENVYAPNTRAFSYLKQMLVDLKEDIYSNTIIVGYTPLSPMERSTR